MNDLSLFDFIASVLPPEIVEAENLKLTEIWMQVVYRKKGRILKKGLYNTTKGFYTSLILSTVR